MPRVIVTGGPGAGKTTLVSHLAAAGYATVHDSARAIIAERLAQGLSRRPEPQEFAREILRRDIDSYQSCAETGDWVFFDRGVIEGIAMVQETAPLPPGDLQNLLVAHAFHRTVFILPPWEEIFTTDAERDQPFTDSVQVYDRLVRWYRACGYALHEVPRLPAAQRATHVLQALASSRG
jgi:predicted ATPase